MLFHRKPPVAPLIFEVELNVWRICNWGSFPVFLDWQRWWWGCKRASLSLSISTPPPTLHLHTHRPFPLPPAVAPSLPQLSAPVQYKRTVRPSFQMEMVPGFHLQISCWCLAGVPRFTRSTLHAGIPVLLKRRLAFCREATRKAASETGLRGATCYWL